MMWIDYKKAYDMVPKSWIIDCLQVYKISGEVIKFIENTMTNRSIEQTAKGKKLNWDENPERNMPGRCAITITICNSDDATQSHT